MKRIISKNKKRKINISAILFAVFIVSLFVIKIGYAASNPFEVTDASIIEKSETTTGDITEYNNDKINNNIIFHQVDDYATYKFSIKNNKSNEITILSITDDNNNEYVVYEYDKHENEKIAKGSTFDFIVKAIYQNELTDTSKRTQSTSVSFTINYLEDGNEKSNTIIINPTTGDNINTSFIILIVSGIGLITGIVLIKKKKKLFILVITITLLAPTIVKAATYKYNILLVSNYELNNKLLVTVNNDGNTEVKEIDYNNLLTLADGEKEGYKFKGWKLDDGTYFDLSTPITEDITLTADYEIQKFEVTFETNGGTSIAKQTINYNGTVTKPIPPTKNNYDFVKWYADQELQTEFNFENNKIKANTVIYAKWEEDIFPTVFEEQEECIFNGISGVITGEYCAYANGNNNYINTGIKLYSSENHTKDYEIGFTIVDYSTTSQVSQATFMNTKYEGTNYPGIVVRRKNAETRFDISSRKTKTQNEVVTLDDLVTKKVKIYRIYNNETNVQEIFYSIDDGEKIKINDLSSFNPVFNTSVWFGATPLDSTETTPQRVLNGTLKDMYIKVGTYKESTKNKVKFNPNGGEVSTSYTKIDKGSAIETLPTPTRENYVFEGWYTKAVGGTKVDSTYIPTDNIVLYAHWKATKFIEVFSHPGECTFNGASGVITGDNCTFANGTNKYIDTNIRLYGVEHHDDDYEIGFTIVDYEPSIQTSQATLMNAKLEGNYFPGVVFRKRSTSNDFDLTSKNTINDNPHKYFNYQSVQKVKIYRIYNDETNVQEIFYSINDGAKVKINDLSEFNPLFDTTVWFGAAPTSNIDLTPQRVLVGTLKDMYIKVGKYTE